MPYGVEAESCDITGKDIKRVLHYEAAKVWFEVVKRPILHPKADNHNGCHGDIDARNCQAVHSHRQHGQGP